MRTTTKYDNILPGNSTEAENPVQESNLQPAQTLVQATKGFEVIAIEVRAIITKAYEADENNNVQS